MSQSTIYVYTMNRLGQVGAWSRYTMPFPTDYFTQLDNDLYIRSGDEVYRLDPSVFTDDGDPFTSVIQWPWLDFGQIGQTKMMAGFDVAGDGTVSVQFGYDQANRSAFTQSWNIDPVTDSVPGGILPMPLAAPSISVKLTYTSTEEWRWDGFTVYLQDFRLTS